jgi:hypothetical protein
MPCFRRDDDYGETVDLDHHDIFESAQAQETIFEIPEEVEETILESLNQDATPTNHMTSRVEVCMRARVARRDTFMDLYLSMRI